MAKTVVAMIAALLLAVLVLPGTRPAAAASAAIAGPAEGASRINAAPRKKAAPARQRAPAAAPKPVEPWDRPMTVVLVRSSAFGCEPLCPEWLAAEGRITAASPSVFRKALKQAGRRWLPIVIRSPGGDVDAAIEIGRMVRKAGLPVGVGWTRYEGCAPGDAACRPPGEGRGAYRGLVMIDDGFCASACPLILAGGTERLVGDRSYVGLHVIRQTWIRQKILYRETVRTVKGKRKVSRTVVSRRNVGSFHKDGIDKPMRKKLAAYLSEMGVSDSFIGEMEKAAFSDINHVPQQRLRDIRLVTSEGSIVIFVTPEVCKAAAPFRNCRALTEEAPPVPADDASGSMRITLVRGAGGCEPLCPEWIAITGRITPDGPARLREVLKAAGDTKLPVFLHSAGGDAGAGIALGRAIREAGLMTVVGRSRIADCEAGRKSCTGRNARGKPLGGSLDTSGICSAECLFVLAGGTLRYTLLTRSAAATPARDWTGAKGSGKEQEQLADYLRIMSVPEDMVAKVTGATAKTPLGMEAQVKLAYGLGTRWSSPVFLAEPLSCVGASPLPNCVRRGTEATSDTRAPSDAGDALPPLVDTEMSVVLVRAKGACEPFCPEWIAAEGTITPDTPRRFAEILRIIGDVRLPVLIDSRGGDFDAAMAIGRMIRAKSLMTVVGTTQIFGCTPREKTCNRNRPLSKPYAGFAYNPGDCARECLFVLAGGVRRLGVWATSGGQSPMAPFRTRQNNVAAGDLVESYLEEMGVRRLTLQVNRAEVPAALASRDDNGVVLVRLSTDDGSTDSVVGSTMCRRADPPANCIRRDKTG